MIKINDTDLKHVTASGAGQTVGGAVSATAAAAAVAAAATGIGAAIGVVGAAAVATSTIGGMSSTTGPANNNSTPTNTSPMGDVQAPNVDASAANNNDSCGGCGGGGGGCFLEGTQVKMADGSNKSIEHIRTGDFIIEALSGKTVRVTGLKTIMHNKNHWIFSLNDSIDAYMTECHPWYDENNQLCAMSDLAERLAPWLGPIKIVEIKNKIKLGQSVLVYNLMLEEGESHYANGVPVSNIVKNGGAWVLYLKGYIDNEVYCDIARNPENHQFDPVFQTRFFNAVNSLSDFVAKNDNICGHAIGKMMAHGFRNRHRIEPLLRKWVNSPIRRKVFARTDA